MTPLVLVHGFMGGAAQWEPQVEALGRHRRILALDLPGFGAASGETAPRSIAGFSDAALDRIAGAGISRFDLLGHSMGGMIAQEMAVRAKGRIGRLILYATGPSGDLPDRFESFETSRRRFVEDDARETAARIAANWFAEGRLAPGYALCAAIAGRASPDAVLAGLDAMADWRGIGPLDRIICPTLVLWGDRDRSYGWRDIEKLWRGPRDCSLAVVPGCGHAVHLEAPEIFNAILARFLGSGPL